jgi:hypothetical protein
LVCSGSSEGYTVVGPLIQIVHGKQRQASYAGG